MNVPADIQRQIIENHRLTNTTHTGGIIDPQRLLTLWKMVCEENDSQLHLVSEAHQRHWVNLRDSTNRKLEEATTPGDVVNALSMVANMVLSVPKVDQYNDRIAHVYDGVAHVEVGEL